MDAIDPRECDFRLGLNASCPAQDYFLIIYSILLSFVSLSFIICVFTFAWRVIDPFFSLLPHNKSYKSKL